jgi:hypothetical protein
MGQSPNQYSGRIEIYKNGTLHSHMTSSWWTYRAMKKSAYGLAGAITDNLYDYRWSYSPDNDAVSKKAFTNRGMDRDYKLRKRKR